MILNERASAGLTVSPLRFVAWIALIVGAVSSPVLTFIAGRSSDERLVVTLMSVWVLAPFALLLVAHRASRRWSAPTQTTLDVLSIGIAACSLVAYAIAVFGSRSGRPAPVLVAVPVLSCLLVLLVLPVAAVLARRSKRRRGEFIS